MRIIYLLLLSLLVAALVSLPFIYTDITITSQGIVRPQTERSELKSSVSAYIDSIWVTEGASVQVGDTILSLRKELNTIKEGYNSQVIAQKDKLISDLLLLCNNVDGVLDLYPRLQTGLYRQQYNSFQYQVREGKARLRKVTQELYTAKILAKDKTISQKELLDAQVAFDGENASLQSIRRQQQARWQEELLRLQNEKQQLENTTAQLGAENMPYVIKSPVAGQVQQFNNKYADNMIQVGETICVISPQTALIAECYVTPKDIGLIHANQLARFQIHAFDYNYFGVLSGRVIAVDNDYTLIDSKPLFKVRCSFSDHQLHLKNGFTGKLQKGMTLTARFTIARRNLWQLLYDNIDDWLNPYAPNPL